MTEFEDQLKKAIDRGHRIRENRETTARNAQLTQDQIRIRHNEQRLAISERIETALKSLVNQLPGFEYENIYGEKGWGGAVSRDELVIQRGKRATAYSRLEMTVKPFSDVHVVDLGAKGTVRNRELLTRHHYRPVEAADSAEFLELVDRWVIEYAQLYIAADAR